MRLPRTLVLVPVVLVALTACGDDDDDDEVQPAPSTTATSEATTTTTAGPASEVYTLRAVTAGDLACYVDVTDTSGEEVTFAGTFNLCPGSDRDATGLIGATVTLTQEPTEMMSEPCEEPDPCETKIEEHFVVAIDPAGE